MVSSSFLGESGWWDLQGGLLCVCVWAGFCVCMYGVCCVCACVCACHRHPVCEKRMRDMHYDLGTQKTHGLCITPDYPDYLCFQLMLKSLTLQTPEPNQ